MSDPFAGALRLPQASYAAKPRWRRWRRALNTGQRSCESWTTRLFFDSERNLCEGGDG